MTCKVIALGRLSRKERIPVSSPPTCLKRFVGFYGNGEGNMAAWFQL